MSPPGRPKGEYRSAQHEGTPVSRGAVPLVATVLQAPGLTAGFALPQWEDLVHEARRANLWDDRRRSGPLAAAAAPPTAHRAVRRSRVRARGTATDVDIVLLRAPPPDGRAAGGPGPDVLDIDLLMPLERQASWGRAHPHGWS
jgi:hypothetical protein